MGDNIDENVWEGEDEIDLTRKITSDDEIESSDDEDEIGTEGAPLDKKAKSKRKFDAMKEKKRLKLESSSQEETNQKVIKQMSAIEMLNTLQSNEPKDAEYIIAEFAEANFFYPDLADSTKTESISKGSCPFVRALSASLPSYKKILLGNEQQKSVEHFGCPTLLIVCASAQRSTEIVKSISAKLLKVKIAKLFAKHFKVQEQIEMLSAEYFPVAVGTPNRINKLIELGALSLRLAKVVLIDITEDSKHYNILNLHEVKHDFYRLLYADVHANRSHLKIAFINQTGAAVPGGGSLPSSTTAGEKRVKKPFIAKKSRISTKENV